MAKFKEPERFLLDNWSDSRQLEQTMEDVRKKYEEVLKRVQEKVKRSGERLDDLRLGKWSRADDDDDGWQLGFGRKQWPRSNWGMCGYWLYNLDLEALTSERGPEPRASIWLKPARQRGVNVEQLGKRIKQEASRLLPKNVQRSPEGEGADHPLVYTLPEDRKVLLGMLVQDDSQVFVDCLASHIETLSQFTPILDKYLLKGKK